MSLSKIQTVVAVDQNQLGTVNVTVTDDVVAASTVDFKAAGGGASEKGLNITSANNNNGIILVGSLVAPSLLVLVLIPSLVRMATTLLLVVLVQMLSSTQLQMRELTSSPISRSAMLTTKSLLMSPHLRLIRLVLLPLVQLVSLLETLLHSRQLLPQAVTTTAGNNVIVFTGAVFNSYCCRNCSGGGTNSTVITPATLMTQLGSSSLGMMQPIYIVCATGDNAEQNTTNGVTITTLAKLDNVSDVSTLVTDNFQFV